MTKIAITALYPDTTAYANGQVSVKLVDGGSGGAVDGGTVVVAQTVRLDPAGFYEIDLTPNADIDPPGTFYALTVVQSSPTVVRYIEVPAPNGTGPSEIPYAWDDETIQRLVIDPPDTIPSASSGTAGQVIGVTDTGNGKRYDLIDVTGGAAAGTPVECPAGELTTVVAVDGVVNPGPYIFQVGATAALEIPDPEDYPGQVVVTGHTDGSSSACIFWRTAPSAATYGTPGDGNHLLNLLASLGGRADGNVTLDVAFTIDGGAPIDVAINDTYNFTSDQTDEIARFFDDLFGPVTGWTVDLQAFIDSGYSEPLMLVCDTPGSTEIEVAATGDAPISAVLNALPTQVGYDHTVYGAFDNATGALDVGDFVDVTGSLVIGDDRHDIIGNAPAAHTSSEFVAIPAAVNGDEVGKWLSRRVMRDDDLHNDDDTWSVLVQGGEGYLNYRQIVKQIDTALAEGGGGGAPSGAAGGDLGGTYPNPTVPGLADKADAAATTTALAAKADAAATTTALAAKADAAATTTALAAKADSATVTTALAGKASTTHATTHAYNGSDPLPVVAAPGFAWASNGAAETVPIWAALANVAAITSGRLLLTPIYLTAGQVVTNVAFVSGTQAAVAPTNQWFGVFSSARVALRLTADDTTTAWGASTAKTLALTTTYTVPTTGMYYLGLMVAASTAPSQRAVTIPTASTPIRPINADTGLTTPPSLPFTAATGTQVSSLIQGWIS